MRLEKNDVEKVLNEIGTNIDSAQLDLLFSSIGDKPLHELMAAGMEKLLAVPAAGAAVAGATASADADKPEEKPEEKEEDVAEDVNVGGLFGDDDEDDY